MSFADEIVTLLNADATLLTLLPGKVHNFPEAGRKGLNRVQIPGAFDPTVGLLNPTALVLELQETPTMEAIHMPNGYMSTITPEVLFVYAQGDNDANGNSPYIIIENAYNQIYKLLHGTQIAGSFQVLWKSTIRDKREPDLKDAAYFRSTFNVHAFRSAS
jgi:hypothetical protein